MTIAILFVMYLLVGAALTATVLPVLIAITGDRALSYMVTVMLWLLLAPIVLGYGELLPGLGRRLRTPGGSRGESKLHASQFGFAFLYGIISSTCLAVGGLSDVFLWPTVVLLIVVGYFVGRDYKRRVFELRRRFRDQGDENIYA